MIDTRLAPPPPALAMGPMILAVALPPLLAYNLTPSATLFNQLAALGGWGLVLLCLGRLQSGASRLMAGPAIAIALMLIAALSAPLLSDAPAAVAWAGAAQLTALLLVARAGSGLGEDDAIDWWCAFCVALVAAGVVSLCVSLIQVFWPELADGRLIARSGLVGRSVGNMRQPNHLASLLIWSCIAAVYLADQGRLRRIGGTPMLLALLFGLIFAIVLSASRTGMIGVGVLAVWGLLDRKLARASRWALLATPLMLALGWYLMSLWAASGHAFGAESRLAEGAGSPSRIAIVANAIELIRRHPWTGVGWGEFNLAWSMTPFPNRPIAFFDHTHNLPLQLAVELGLPAALLICALLAIALVRALRASMRASGREAVMRRCAFMVVLMIGVHSLVEYPLWYAYFLLPTAFAFGVALRAPEPSRTPSGGWLGKGLGIAGVALLIGCALALADYRRVVAIYVPSSDARSLVERIAIGQRSPLFSAQADYAAATSLPSGPAALEAARRTAHNLIDVRLMIAWAKSLDAVGDTERARYVAQRLREFRSREGDAWLAECDAFKREELRPFQCDAPQREFNWRELR